MIYSKKYNFMYFKNKKVGGSSTEICLSQIMDENAIVTPVNPIDEKHNPRNFDGFYNHALYSEVSENIDLENVDTCVVVRNPYDSVLSDFFLQLEYTNNMQNLGNQNYKEEILERIDSDMDILVNANVNNKSEKNCNNDNCS
jgi:hypothetical protein